MTTLNQISEIELPAALWDMLRQLAEANKRSTTGQIEFILENYLEQRLTKNKLPSRELSWDEVQKIVENEQLIREIALPAALFDMLSQLAEHDKRSTTGQIEFILENYLEQQLAENERQ